MVLLGNKGQSKSINTGREEHEVVSRRQILMRNVIKQWKMSLWKLRMFQRRKVIRASPRAPRNVINIVHVTNFGQVTDRKV